MIFSRYGRITRPLSNNKNLHISYMIYLYTSIPFTFLSLIAGEYKDRNFLLFYETNINFMYPVLPSRGVAQKGHAE